MDKLLVAEIEAAILDKRTVTFIYTACHGNAKDVTRRTIKPYTLSPEQVQGYHYVTGYCRMRRSMRTFRTDRMELTKGGLNNGNSC